MQKSKLLNFRSYKPEYSNGNLKIYRLLRPIISQMPFHAYHLSKLLYQFIARHLWNKYSINSTDELILQILQSNYSIT